MKLKRIRLAKDNRAKTKVLYKEYIGWYLCFGKTIGKTIYRKVSLYDIHLRAMRKQKVKLVITQEIKKEILAEVA